MQVSRFLRRASSGFAHWCPGCAEAHIIPDSWTFDGNLEAPTFSQSVKITGVQTEVKDGEWTGKWILDAEGKPLPYCCHYILTAGKLAFCADCTHALKGQEVDLPELPGYLLDKETET